MKLYIDTEFNEYRGALISLALVADDGSEWYGVRYCDDPGWWVREHVMPHLNQRPARDADLRDELARYLAQFDSVHIVSDWPGDIAHFCNFLEYAPGERIGPDTMTFEVRRDLPDTATTSAIPHNALEDARALARAVMGDGTLAFGLHDKGSLVAHAAVDRVAGDGKGIEVAQCTRCGRYENGSRPCPQVDSLCPVAAAPAAVAPGEGETPADARMLRFANHALAAESHELQDTLADLYEQVKKFCAEQGEADFETGRALHLLSRVRPLEFNWPFTSPPAAVAQAEPVAAMFRDGLSNCLVRWEDGAMALPDGEHKLYTAPPLPERAAPEAMTDEQIWHLAGTDELTGDAIQRFAEAIIAARDAQHAAARGE